MGRGLIPGNLGRLGSRPDGTTGGSLSMLASIYKLQSDISQGTVHIQMNIMTEVIVFRNRTFASIMFMSSQKCFACFCQRDVILICSAT